MSSWTEFPEALLKHPQGTISFKAIHLANQGKKSCCEQQACIHITTAHASKSKQNKNTHTTQFLPKAFSVDRMVMHSVRLIIYYDRVSMWSCSGGIYSPKQIDDLWHFIHKCLYLHENIIHHTSNFKESINQ